MNTDRMKFAWARGARIQARAPSGGPWESADPAFVIGRNVYGWYMRIHPDDAHLEYGPLSSALLADLMTTWVIEDPHGYADAAWELFHIERRKHGIARFDDMDALLFCEYLADMGL